MGLSRAALPLEACGLLSGPADIEWSSEPVGEVWQLWPVANARSSPIAFELDGAEMLAAEKRIDDLGHVVVGVMHSHPTSEAVPSSRDVADASAFDPFGSLVHLVVSMQGFAPTVRAWRLLPEGDPVAIDIRSVPVDLRSR